MNEDDRTILSALRLSRVDLIEDLDHRESVVLAEIADDMRDVLPCSEEFFEEELPRRYGLDVMGSDEDMNLNARILSRLLRYAGEKHDAPFLVMFADEKTLRGAEVVDRQMLPTAASPVVLPPVLLGTRRSRCHR